MSGSGLGFAQVRGAVALRVSASAAMPKVATALEAIDTSFSLRLDSLDSRVVGLDTKLTDVAQLLESRMDSMDAMLVAILSHLDRLSASVQIPKVASTEFFSIAGIDPLKRGDSVQTVSDLSTQLASPACTNSQAFTTPSTVDGTQASLEDQLSDDESVQSLQDAPEKPDDVPRQLFDDSKVQSTQSPQHASPSDPPQSLSLCELLDRLDDGGVTLTDDVLDKVPLGTLERSLYYTELAEQKNYMELAELESSYKIAGKDHSSTTAALQLQRREFENSLITAWKRAQNCAAHERAALLKHIAKITSEHMGRISLNEKFAFTKRLKYVMQL